ncbi:hypothetical protein ACJX0J_011725, partial [Zea mays]
LAPTSSFLIFLKYICDIQRMFSIILTRLLLYIDMIVSDLDYQLPLKIMLYITTIKTVILCPIVTDNDL